MSRRRARVGSMALLFTVVLVCMAVFSALTVMTAAQDLGLARQYADHVKEAAQCESLGQRWLAQVHRGELPAGTWQEGDRMGVTLETESMELEICLRLTENSCEILRWSCAAKWQPQENYSLWH